MRRFPVVGRRFARRGPAGSGGRWGARGAVMALAGIGLASACARALPPPGGERDEASPQVARLAPEPGATVRPTDDPAVIEFDERISEQNYRDAIYVSPVTGAVDVSKGRRDLEVRVAGGWQPGRVYRIVVRPVLRDMFNNPVRREIEWSFSTGAPFSDAAAAGLVYERVTGSPVADARVEARPLDGSLSYHLSITDSAGIFRLPLLPPGSYMLRAYADQNRDRTWDPFEAVDSALLEIGAADTILRPLAIMRVDSTAANLVRVSLEDSLTLRAQFDDYMDIGVPQERASLLLRSLPDSTTVPLAGVFYPHALEALRAREDSIARAAADTLRTDSTGAAVPSDPPASAGRGPRAGNIAGRDSMAVDTLPPDPLVVRVRQANLRPVQGDPLPSRELMVRLPSPLTPETEYVLSVGGILNLSGIPDGGGSVTFTTPAAPPPAAADEAGGDAAGVSPPQPDAGSQEDADVAPVRAPPGGATPERTPPERAP